MATKVHMEALSPTMEEGQVVKWHKAEGDSVSQGEVLADIETDKATMELVARGKGILRRILTAEGQSAPVGEVIAVIGQEGEDIGALVGAGAAPEQAGEEPREEEAAQPAATALRTAPPATANGGRVKASPLARRLAAEAGLELSRLQGSGPGGRIVKRDVEEAAERAPAPARLGVPAPGAPTEEDYEEIPLSQMRKTIARRLAESIGPVPHYFLTIDLDMDRARHARARINALLDERGEKVSMNDLIIRAVAGALRQHPAVNSAWHGDRIRRWRRVHVGVAVAEGLITPVIRDADRKGVAEIASEARELAGRARAKKLKPEEYTGATFSVSNLGMLGIHEFTAVINPPEAGILAVGQVEEHPVVMSGQVVVRPRMLATMSCDHRVIDGATGARFLQTLKAMLEEPAAILL